jgi:hypothetical protein
MISEAMVHLAQTVHLSWIKISTISKQTETSFHLKVATYEYHQVSKTISEPMVRLAQIVELSCTKTNTISKRMETRFYMTHVT